MEAVAVRYYGLDYGNYGESSGLGYVVKLVNLRYLCRMHQCYDHEPIIKDRIACRHISTIDSYAYGKDCETAQCPAYLVL